MSGQFAFKRPAILNRPEPVVSLTPMGKQQMEAFEGSGPRFQVMAYLFEHGASSVKAIAKGTGMEYHKVKVILRQLLREDLVSRIK